MRQISYTCSRKAEQQPEMLENEDGEKERQYRKQKRQVRERGRDCKVCIQQKRKDSKQ